MFKPVIPRRMNYLFKNSLYFSIRQLNLSVTLRMICYSNIVFNHQILKMFIAKMESFIFNDGFRRAMSIKYVFDKKIGHYLNIISGGFYYLYPFRNII